MSVHPSRTLAAMLLVFLLLPAAATAAVLSGIVIDERNAEPVRGARIELLGSDLKTTSDISGNFAMQVPDGDHEIRIVQNGFQPQVLSVTVSREENIGVVLAPASREGEPAFDESAIGTAAESGETAVATASESESGSAAAAPASEPESRAFAQSVTVTATSIQASEEALLVERKSADDIQDSIGRIEISKSADSTSASVMQRVTGVQVSDGKYVYVRGLGERYSNTTVNGSIIPTTEPEKRVVPLDLFSANLLNKVSVAKSYTPDKPGEFAAGFVELETLDFPASQTLSISLGSTWESGTTGKRVLGFGSGLSFTGGGGLGLPSSFPKQRVVKRGLFSTEGFTAQELEEIGKSIQSGWEPTEQTAEILPNMSLNWGNTLGRLGVVLSASHSSSYDVREETQTYYSVGEAGQIKQSHNYDMVTGEEQVRQGLVANLAYRLTPNNQLRLQTLYTQTGTSEGRQFEGFNVDAYNNLRDERIKYQKEAIFTGKLSGDHYFANFGFGSGSLLEWQTSGAEGTNEENLRQTQYKEISPEVYQLADEPMSGLMLYNDLTDTVEDSQLSYSIFFSNPSITGSLKFGGAMTSRERDFQSRRLRFVPNSRANIDFTLPANELYTPANIGPAFEIREETRATDSYDAGHDISAGYMMADATFGRWRVVAGGRLESSDQEVVTFDLFNREAAPLVTRNEEEDFLPAVNMVYALTPAMNFRAAYSETVNRPEFRELAPFEFSDVRGGRATVGNPNLIRASIESYDLRWEWFPRSDEVVAASVFLKQIVNPIERVIRPTQQLSTSFANAAGADNFGVELEFRRSLAFLNPAWDEWSLVTNYTWVDSQIDISNLDQRELTSTERPLVGQAEHIYNLTTEYAPERMGAIFRLLYNYTGEKITDVGARGLPDIYQDARNMIDFVWLQDLSRWSPGLRLKASAENLLDEERTYTIGDNVYNAYKTGREFGLSLSYNFF
jgi:outer membrane receptor protein involved in Fe transport